MIDVEKLKQRYSTQMFNRKFYTKNGDLYQGWGLESEVLDFEVTPTNDKNEVVLRLFLDLIKLILKEKEISTLVVKLLHCGLWPDEYNGAVGCKIALLNRILQQNR